MTAPTPPGPNDSVTFSQFTGLNNRVTSERLGPSELEVAENIDIDAAGQIHRRRGATLIAEGVFHSLFRTYMGHVFVVKDGVLGYLQAGTQFVSLDIDIGDDPVAYAALGGRTFFSSRAISGVVNANMTTEAWGEETAPGQWVSPVVSPTATLPDTFGRLLAKPPLATALALMNGRIYLGAGSMLWATMYLRPMVVDRTRGFKQFESPITLLGAVGDGIYVGTEADCWFVSGNFDEAKRDPVMVGRVVPGSWVPMPADVISKQFRDDRVKSSRLAGMFLTDGGIYAGFDSGVCYNLSSDKVLLPSATSAAAMYRQMDGMDHYVVAADSGGTPVQNVRIGDFLDVEVIRFRPPA